MFYLSRSHAAGGNTWVVILGWPAGSFSFAVPPHLVSPSDHHIYFLQSKKPVVTFA